MATAKPIPATPLPEGFTYPFKRVQMEERIDDSLACIATLTGQTLETIKNLAFDAGLPKHGPAWVYQDMVVKLLSQFGLLASEWKEVSSIAALPDVALLSVDVTKYDYGRMVVFTHFRATDKYKSFSAVCDPGDWLDPKHHITTDFKHLKIVFPLWYIEVNSRPAGKAK